MPKICHIITAFYNTAGSTRRTLLEIDYQMKTGYDVHLIVGKDASSDLIKKYIEKGYKVIQVASLLKYIDVKSDLKALLAIMGVLQEQKYDLVHTHLAKAGIIGSIVELNFYRGFFAEVLAIEIGLALVLIKKDLFISNN